MRTYYPYNQPSSLDLSQIMCDRLVKKILHMIFYELHIPEYVYQREAEAFAIHRKEKED